MEFTPRCPTCRAIVAWDGNVYRPFCSERCQLIDLGQWAAERYRVPGAPTEPEVPDDDSDERLHVIHGTAVVSADADIHPTAEIGSYVVIEGAVRIGAGTRVMAHVVLRGPTEIGERNIIHPGAVLGGEPQDLAFAGDETFLRIGDDNVFREHVTAHRGTVAGSATVIGDGNYFMQNAHVAHNCRIGNGTIVAGGALLAGHVEVADRAFVSGNCVVHQHVRIGRLALLRGLARTSRDVPPFCIIDGTHTVRGVNTIGLRRAGFDDARITAIRRAVVALFGRPTHLGQALAVVEAGAPTDDVRELTAFVRASKRGVCVPPRTRRRSPAPE